MTENIDGMMPDQEILSEMAMSQMDMAKLIRDAAGDALTAIPGVEEMVQDLTKVLRTKIVSFTKEDVEYIFSGMRMFDDIPEEDEETILKIRVVGENESRIAALLAHPEPVRHILAILLGGTKASVSDFAEGSLRPSEASLFLLFADQLVTGLAESVDIIGNYGVPGAPAVSSKKEFKQFYAGHELVALEFSVGFEKDMKEFEFLVPLEVFDLIKFSREDESESSRELSEEEVWDSMLVSHVDNLQIPMDVELAALDISLAKLGEMQIGETFSVTPTKGGLRILDEMGATAFVADLEIDNRKFGLRVAENRQKEEA